MIIECNTCRLRPWQFGDEATLTQNANNKKIWGNLRDFFPHPYTPKDAESWITLQKEAPILTNFAIEVAGAVVGGIGLIPGKDIFRLNAEIGYWLGEDYWRKGIVGEAVPVVVKHGFEELGFQKIFAAVFEHNIASMKVLEKNGFVKEAVLKKGVIKNNVLLDEHYYAIWRE